MNPVDEESNQERNVPLPSKKLFKAIWFAAGRILHSILVKWKELLGCCSIREGKWSINAIYKCRLINAGILEELLVLCA